MTKDEKIPIENILKIEVIEVEILHLFHSIYVNLNTSRQCLILYGFGSRIIENKTPVNVKFPRF